MMDYFITTEHPSFHLPGVSCIPQHFDIKWHQMKKYRETGIFLAGMTPQIVTETIYALSQKKPPVHLDEMFIITTSAGRACIEETLNKDGVLVQLAKEYGLPPVELRDDSFVLIRDRSGEPLADIRNDRDSEAVGDVITAFIREKAADPSVRLHCSIAGGRKTMSFYMGAALQMFGRPQDRLYHVLVSPAFESNPDFFYPPRKPRLIECRMADGTKRKISSAKAEIHLAELPFIRLESKLLFAGKSFRKLVVEGQRELDTAVLLPSIHINLHDRTVRIGEKIFSMPPVMLMLYVRFMKQKLEKCSSPTRVSCSGCTECYVTLAELSEPGTVMEMVRDYARIYAAQPARAEEMMHRWKNGIRIDTLRQNISKINIIIRKNLDDEAIYTYFSINADRKYAASRYGVRMDRRRIKIL